MKKLLSLTLLVLALGTQAQLVKKEGSKFTIVGEHKRGGTVIFSLKYGLLNKDTLYLLTYRNGKYTEIVDYQSFSFKGAQTCEDLYQAMGSFLTDESKQKKEYSETYDMGDIDVTLSHYRLLGKDYVWVYTREGYFMVDRKALDQLFGKL